MNAVTDSLLARPRTGTGWERPRLDPAWWAIQTSDHVHLRDALRMRDMTVVFRFLTTRGWSRAAIAAATGLSENRVRAVIQGRQEVTSYDVLERIAEGLHIERGLMGMAYTTASDWSVAVPRVVARSVSATGGDAWMPCGSRSTPRLGNDVADGESTVMR